jgi:hypothetical protein
MSTPRRNFRIEDEVWIKFVTKARENKTSGSALLKKFIEEYLKG